MPVSKIQNFQRGAIVSCFFPLSEAPDLPGPTARPALVVGVFFDRLDRRWKVIVAYGTSRKTRANSGFEIRINHPESLALAGLNRPTRFTLSRMRVLPLTPGYFNPNGDGPVLGVLDDVLLARLDKTCTILASIADPLRVLDQPCSLSIHPTDVATPIRVEDIPLAGTIAGQGVDQFMQDHCNGRADLGGLRKRA